MIKFIDTAPFIYLVENNPDFADKVANLITVAIINGDKFETSVITLMEFGVKPEREGKHHIIDKFKELLRRLNINLTIIDEKIAERGYQLRSKYKFLKGMDALQIAAALELDCNEFITNDDRLKKITEIQITVIKDI